MFWCFYHKFVVLVRKNFCFNITLIQKEKFNDLNPYCPGCFKKNFEMKINLNFCFYIILWYRKGLHKTFWATTKNIENKLKLQKC